MNKKFIIYGILVLAFALIDQISKEIARNSLGPLSNIVVIPGFLELTLVQNRGISFGLFSQLGEWSRILFLTVLPCFVVGGIIFYTFKNINSISRWDFWGYALIAGGAVGNLYDRIVYSSVTDFAYFKFFGKGLFVNNIADDFISIGLLLIILNNFFGNTKKSKKH